MLGRGRYDFSSRYLQGAFRGWGYEDFTAGAITSTSVTLSDNENGTDSYGFETGRIISGSGVIVRKDYPSRKPYTGMTRLFSTKVEVSTHTSNTTVTLSGVPHSTWGDIRIYYLYDYPLGVPQDYQIPSKAVSGNLFAELQDLFLSEEDLSATAPVTYSSQTIALDYDSNDFEVSGSSLAIQDSGIDHDELANFLANEHIDWTDTTEDFLTTGTLGAGAITGTSFIIGANTLDTNEWAFLDGLDQALKTTDDVAFAGITATDTIQAEHLYSTDDLVVDDDATISGNLGVGVAPTAGYLISASKSVDASNAIGVWGGITNTKETGAISSVYGLAFTPKWYPASLEEDKSLGIITGAVLYPSVQTPEATAYNMSVVTLSGYYVHPAINRGIGSGTLGVTNLLEFHARDPSTSNNPTIGTLYAFYDGGMTKGTTNWGLAINTQSYINGNLGIGSTDVPTEALHFAEAKNIATGTSTGTKIGTATTQKIGFWNTTPVVQQAHIADAAVAAGDPPTKAEFDAFVGKFNTLLSYLDADAGVGLLAGA